MFRNRIKRGLRRLFKRSGERRQSCLAAAVIEMLEQRQLLSFTVTHEPYLQLSNAPLVGSTNYAGSDQIQIIWQTSGAADGEQFIAQFRVVGAPGWTSATVTQAPTEVTTNGVLRRNRMATITGLPFDTAHEYQITHDKVSGTDPVYAGTFRTRLAPGSTNNFSFVAYGDSADFTHISDFQNVITRVNAINPAFTVLLGDNAYSDGSYDQMEYRLNPSFAGTGPTGFIRNHIEYPTYGNHDVGNGGDPNSPNVAGAPGQPTEYNFDVPVPSTTTSLVPAPVSTRLEHNYSFDYGSVHFLSFDGNFCDVPTDNCITNDSTTLDRILDWAVADLKESDARWKIVMVHQPVYSLRGHVALTRQTTYYNKVLSRLGRDGAGADLLLAGHSHNYQRSFPLIGPYDDGIGHAVTTSSTNYIQGDGITQVITGLGGHAIESTAAGTLPGILAKVLSGTSGATAAAYSVLKIDVTSNVLTLTQVKASDGTPMDTFTITAPNDTTVPNAFLAGPLDNGTADSDADPGQVTVTTSQTAFVIKLKDAGDGINDASAASSSTVTLVKDGVTLVSGTDYTYTYDAATNRIRLTAPVGLPFAVGAYEITINGVADSHGTPNVMPATTLTVNIETAVNTAALIAKGTQWRFWHTTGGTASDPFVNVPDFANWNQPSFVDSGWTLSTTGTTPLGYGPLNENGTNVTGRDLALPNPGNRFTSYFRKTFTISEPAKILSLVVNLLRDDGAVVYLNGTEVIRTSNMAPGSPTFTTLANHNGSAAIDGAFETAYFGYRIDPSLLVAGTNLIAVEVHQQATSSGDLAFELELLGRSPRVTQTFSGGNLVINGTTRNDLLNISSNGTNVTVNGVVLTPLAAVALVTSITVNGRAGNDTIDLTNVNSTQNFVESALHGHITLQGDAGDDIITGSNISHATLDGDRLVGGLGNDNISGGGGRDILIGGAGRDTLTGGADFDTADYSANTSSQSISISLNGSPDDNDGLGTSNESVNVEAVLGGAGNDSLTGGAGGDFLKGNGGSDTIHGDGGSDTLFGDADYDRVYGDDGDDEIHGGAGGDALFGDRIAYAGPGNPGNDVIWGDADNDDINGGHWAIAANDGSDVIHGGTGSDRYYFIGGNIGNDVVDDATDMAPVDIDWIIFNWGWSSDITLHLDAAYVGLQQNLSGGGSITLSNANSIENVWTGTGNDWIYGDDRGNYLDGQAGNDHIYGGPGNDQLAGYDGYDYLYGEGDDDWMWPEYDGGEMWGGLGNDTYDFVMTYGPNYFVYEAAIVGGTDGSSDTLDFTGSLGPVNIDLASTGYQYMFITLKLSDGMGIENVYTSQNDFFNWGDTIYGNARPNILKGGVGNDSLYGRAGADTLWGEAGNDYLDPGGSDGAADSIIGGDGDDTLVNHDGPDVWNTIEHVL